MKKYFGVILLIILPLFYYIVYHALRLYFIGDIENVIGLYGPRVGMLICAVIVCLFTILILFVCRNFYGSSALYKILAIVILVAHLAFSWFFPHVINYFNYIEVIVSFIFILGMIVLDLAHKWR